MTDRVDLFFELQNVHSIRFSLALCVFFWTALPRKNCNSFVVFEIFMIATSVFSFNVVMPVCDKSYAFSFFVKADHFPENIDSEVGKLRQEFLKRNNEIQQIEEREYELNYKVTA